ncbi:MAG: type II toxin-antitoxin system PemK/MazF family toxin [Nitrospira sp. SB0677_bin_15]|nr:type II toxin-antitoxin system PemK/MazF family toxin [Nitrospira sp. SB0667_bin_9]MYD32079.1 type II toxin-antitoxin system PemK/MazF family toxin [Nitrospira sp. SB0661_bin_20]MYG41303.1 type II toxin-antitoxin system PemK/MazF family toxin [Nitrospira sp. SB0677_bin_15]MYH02910.1 type II toxin-antitoxin system PemK/MazF family toxin [Nitrospira sp. SB0675_bin_23]MYJ23535.1 type II toxin-antitoxin system PemK/MazF family toxin [Nitrospira sp. SB0673_bin_12]
MICKQWDVVVVPFPFTEQAGNKRRPAVVLSKKLFNAHGHTLLLMITTQAHQPWPGDTEITHFQVSGLSRICVVRLKAFTLDNRLILKRLGALSTRDGHVVAQHVEQYLL